MSEPRHGLADLLEHSAGISAAARRVIRGASDRLEHHPGALLRLWRTPAIVATLLVLFLGAVVMGSLTPGAQAQETEECDYVWCGSATVKAGAGDAGGVGYKPGTDYPGSTLDTTTFTYDDVSYTVGGIVNDPGDGEVTLLLTPLPDADTVLPLTFRVGDTVLPFAEGTRSETDGAYSWSDSTEFGAESSPFADDASIEFAIANDALPGAPNIYLAFGSNGDRITMVWTAPNRRGARSIQGYKVEVSEDSGSTWSVVAVNEPSTAFFHGDLLAETTYDYRVSAVNSIGAGETSAAVSASTGPGNPPKAPTSLTAVGGSRAITLSWVPPVRKGGAPITGYRIDVSTSPGPWTAVASSTSGTTYTHTGRTDGVRYTYRVAAITSFRLGRWSESVTAVTRVLAPGAPTNVSATPNGIYTWISWRAPASDGGAAITGYLVEVSTDEATWTELASSVAATSYSHQGVTIGTTYYYRVSARNSVWLGAPSDTASVTARVVTAPSAPYRMTATAHGITINLSWGRALIDGNDPALTYVLETSTAEETWETLAASTTALSYAHAGLDLATTYHYRVSARNTIGLSEPSSTATATTWEALYAPGTPQNLTGIADGTTINLSWEAPDSDGGVTISSYHVETSTDGETWTEAAAAATGTTYAHTGLTLGTIYRYQVSARNSQGLSTPSDATSVTALETVVGPGAPRNVAASSGGRHTVELSWDPPASDGGASVISYKIERAERTAYHDWSVVVADTGSRDTTYVDGGLYAGELYSYRVSAINAAGSVGSPTARADTRTDRPSVPSAPLNLRGNGVAIPQPTRAAVGWDPPEDDGGDRRFRGYKLEVSVGTGDERNWVVLADNFRDRTYFDPHAEPGQTRTYRVRAINSRGPGPWSEEVTFLVPAIKPGPPRDLAVTIDGPRFKLAWKAPSNNGGADITGYRIEASTDQESWVADPDTVITLHHSLSGLNYGVAYYFRVSAINSAGAGAASATANGQVSCAIWCGAATLSDNSSNTALVGYSTADTYSGSTLTPNTFTHDSVEYTVSSFVNNTSNGSVEMSLSPALSESARGALTLHLGSVSLPFSSATSIGGLVTWLPSALGLSDFSFADGDSIRLLITES